MLTSIHEFKGEQPLFIEAHADELTKFMNIATIQSIKASNKIEGISISDERLKKLVMDKTMPTSRDEQEIAGYRDVLNTIHEIYDFVQVKPGVILQFHRDLYKFQGPGAGGKYKSSDNIIAETDSDGNRKIRFQPVPAWETPDAIENLCQAYHNALQNEHVDSLILIPMFVKADILLVNILVLKS